MNYLTFGLSQGFIHDWLVAGPLPVAGESTGDPQAIPASLQPPGQPLHLELLHPDEASVRWEYWRCGEDHLIHSGPPTSEAEVVAGRLRTWAYAQLHVPAAAVTNAAANSIVLTANRATRLWHNDALVSQRPGQDSLQAVDPAHLQSTHYTLALKAGINHFLVCMESDVERTDGREAVCRVALAFPDLTADETEQNPGIRVALPTSVQHVERFQAFAALFEHAYLDRECFYGDEMLGLQWGKAAADALPVALRLQVTTGRTSARIYAETLGQPKPGGETNLVSALTVTPGLYDAILMPQPQEYATEKVRVRRSFQLHVLNAKPETTPQTTYLERLAAALRTLIQQRQGLPGQIAMMALGAWQHIHPDTLRAALLHGREGSAARLRNLIGLYSLLARYGSNPSFPNGLRQELSSQLRNVRIPDDSPPNGVPQNGRLLASHGTNPAGSRESDRLLLFTAQILIGRHAPTQPIGAGGRTGSELRRQGEASVLDWLRACGRTGFQFCLDESQLDDLIFALNQLVTLAPDETVRELAAVVLDKLFFTLALTTHRGIGSGGLSGASTHAAYLLWGIGALSQHPWITVALADSHYTVPDFIAEIAQASQAEEWSRQRHTGGDGAWSADWATYRTPDYLLSALQDYRPGAQGMHEQVWCATLGDRARVFTTHPRHCGPDLSDGPGFWQGNCVLPRVAQWQDVVIAIHHLPPGDWLGFTHAHFPLYAFDEHVFTDNWAFARHGQAYLALTASTPFEVVETGAGAYRELRAPGDSTVWLCQMGRATRDGSFADFQEKVGNCRLQFSADDFTAVDYTDVRGNDLHFAWDGPFLRNGARQTLSSPCHYHTPYAVTESPAHLMQIQVGDTAVQLDFS